MIYSSLLSQLDWLEHGFGTRAGPLSQEGMATLTQIHSASVLVADRAGLAGEGDALVTERAGVPLSVRTADCYPILLADLESRVVAAVHAGWRGTSARVVVAALERMNAVRPIGSLDRVWAAIGPGIGACCYEVGPEVARLFGQPGLVQPGPAQSGLVQPGVDQPGVVQPQKRRLDLAEANRRQLLEAGVPDRNIDLLRHCTRCDAERFHSYRRDGEQAGRMISWIAVTTH